MARRAGRHCEAWVVTSIALLSCLWLLLLPSLPSEELAESRLSSGESCLAPAGGPEGVGCVAWLLFIIDAAALFAIILLYFDGVSMMGESGEIGRTSGYRGADARGRNSATVGWWVVVVAG